MRVRTRFAPSPTGFLHIAGIRTALYCYALSKQNKGDFVIRIEDTDQSRLVEGAVEHIFQAFREYGLEPDESKIHGGNYGPYVQSQRLDLYQSYAEQLIEKGAAYYCFLTKEETEKLQEAQRKSKKGLRSPYRDMSKEEAREKIKSGESFVIRQRIPDNETIHFEDGLQGNMKFDTNQVSDGILLKSDGFPTYHLAMLVDDHLMEISHVFRGVEWIPSVPKHVLLYRAMGWDMPQIFHLTLILDPAGGKLSKRNGAVSALQFLEEGYIPEAILNFLMLLGWSSPEEREHGAEENEFFSLDRFVELFSVKDLNKSSPIFDRKKLLWFNGQYLQEKGLDEYRKIFLHWVEKYLDDEDLKNIIQTDTNLDEKLEQVKERAKLLKDTLNMIKFFYSAPAEYDVEIKQLKRVKEDLKEITMHMQDLIQIFEDDSSAWTHESWENGMRQIGDDLEHKHGDIFMALRVAIVGEPFSPPLFESLQILGKYEVLSRLDKFREVV